MGQCISATEKKAEDAVRHHRRSQDVSVDQQLANIGEIAPDEGEATPAIRAMPTQSGRFLLSAKDQPLTAEEKQQMTAVIKENPEAQAKLAELADAAQMGLQLKYSKSPAFIGLAVIDVHSAELEGYKAPQIQIVCEDDKSKYVKCKPSTDRTSSFEWENTKLIFVVVFSHAEMTVQIKEGAFNAGVGNKELAAQLRIADFVQHPEQKTIQLRAKGKEEVGGTVSVTIDYKWLRGTEDQGMHTHIDKLTVERRKMNGLKNLVSHISNVNHWMMSHDNIWPALDPKHPLVAQARQQTRNSRSVSVKDRSRGSHEKRESQDMRDSQDGADPGNVTLDQVPTSDGELQSWQNEARRRMSNNFGGAIEGGKTNATADMFEYAVADSLKAVENEPQGIAHLKHELANLFGLVSERLSEHESKIAHQEEIIMDLTYRLDKAQGKAHKMPYLSGRFGYGLGRAASNREVLLFAKQAQAERLRADWPTSFLGKHKTDKDGKLGPIELPVGMVSHPGHYDIVALLPEDNTFARGSLYLLRPGTKCVLFDMDGTITVGDQEVVGQFGMNALAGSTAIGDRLLTQAWDQKARAHARTVVRLWAAKGYQVVYLSGRQGSFYNLTIQWLIKHNFPPGPIHLTRTHMPTLPVFASVGNFKVQYMEELKRKGFVLYAAYGNTGTDVRAYAAAGIAKERTFTIGQASGAGGTIAMKNCTRHLPMVLEFPDSNVPVDYVDLLWCAVPQHRGDTKSSSGRTGGLETAESATNLSASGVTSMDPKNQSSPDEVPASVLDAEGGDDDESDEEYSTSMPTPSQRHPPDGSGGQPTSAERILDSGRRRLSSGKFSMKSASRKASQVA